MGIKERKMSEPLKTFKHPASLHPVKSTGAKVLLEIAGKVHQKVFIGNTVTEPIFFLSVYDGYIRKDDSKSVTIQFSEFDLTTLSVALSGYIEHKGVAEWEYKKFSGSSGDKRLYIGSSSGTFYLNFESPMAGRIAFPFNHIEGRALARIIDRCLTETLDKSAEISWRSYEKQLRNSTTPTRTIPNR